jgi:hypothetical protein
MARPRAPYDTAELERVKRNLSGFLSCDEPTAANLAKLHSTEVRPLARALQDVMEQLNHKWPDAVLAQIPPSELMCDHNNMLRISADSASMRFLGADILVVGGLSLVKVRESLMDGLVDSMAVAAREAYSPMLSWVEVDECPFISGTAPLSSDSLFGQGLLFIEQQWENQVAEYDSHYRINERLPDGVVTPSAVLAISAERAAAHLVGHMDKWLAGDVALPESVPESLLARVAANVSVNRLLLERASKNARGLEAASMCERFLSELNRHGINQIPEEMQNCEMTEARARLKEWLTDRFAHGGILTCTGEYFARRMTTSDIDAIVDWGSQLQTAYLAGRGLVGEDPVKAAVLAEKSHGRTLNYFIFSITLVAAFYERTATAREFKGHSNPSYAVFPSRGDMKKGLRDAPSVHASELLQQAYGQIYFTNDDWSLLGESIRVYAENLSIKRAYAEQLLFYAVKGRTSRQLLALHQNIQRLIRPANEPDTHLR